MHVSNDFKNLYEFSKIILSVLEENNNECYYRGPFTMREPSNPKLLIITTFTSEKWYESIQFPFIFVSDNVLPLEIYFSLDINSRISQKLIKSHLYWL